MEKIKGVYINEDSAVIGEINRNPLLNSILYDVVFPDWAIKKYSANTIAESLYPTVDRDGCYRGVLDSILSQNKDE